MRLINIPLLYNFSPVLYFTSFPPSYLRLLCLSSLFFILVFYPSSYVFFVFLSSLVLTSSFPSYSPAPLSGLHETINNATKLMCFGAHLKKITLMSESRALLRSEPVPSFTNRQPALKLCFNNQSLPLVISLSDECGRVHLINCLCCCKIMQIDSL